MKTNRWDRFNLVAVVVSAVLGFGGAGAVAQATPPASPAQDLSTNDSGGIDTQAMRDKMFVRKSAEGGLAEVQLGQLALQKASSENVKKFAQRMVDDHTALNDSMKPFATSFGLKLPTSLSKPDQAEYTRLASLSGEEFDKQYLAVMTRDHHKDLKEFTEEAAAASDPALRDVVANERRVIAHHAHMADHLAAENAISSALAAGPSK